MLRSGFKQRRENQSISDSIEKTLGGEKRTMEETKKAYKNKVLFMRVSKRGAHLYAFNHDNILAEGLDSLLINKSDMEKLLKGEYETIKISAMVSKNSAEAMDIKNIEDEFGDELENLE